MKQIVYVVLPFFMLEDTLWGEPRVYFDERKANKFIKENSGQGITWRLYKRFLLGGRT